MPGRNPQEAADAFLEPLKEAVRVLDGFGQIIVGGKEKGGYRKGREFTWYLNGHDVGMSLRGLGTFHAEMRFEIIDADEKRFGAPLRVKTNGYLYRLTVGDGDLWRIHWHPVGYSPHKEPHVHVQPDLELHRPTGRITFEKVIRWCIEDGAPLRCTRQDALDRLALCEAPHLLHRTWSDHPSQAEQV